MSLKMPKPENEAKFEQAIQMFASGNYTQKQMCEELEINPTTLYRWKQTEEFQSRLRNEIKSKMADYVGMALRNIATLATNADSETVRLNANKELMEKFGITSKQEIDINATTEIVIDIQDNESSSND